MKRTRTADRSLSLAQVRAIGRMTINFNWLEHGIEVLIQTIISDPSGEKHGLTQQTLKPLGFRQKLQVLRGLAADLADHYVPSPELDHAYARFASEIKSLITAAEHLNDFRNNVVHWRPFLTTHKWEKSPKFTTVSAAEINAKAFEMDNIGTRFFARSIYLHKGDGSLTFGAHMRRN